MMILASNNRKKLAEMSAILADFGEELVMQKDHGLDLEVEETGTTFEENAYLKAAAVTKLTGLPAVADDSGLVVEALDGEPGVYSARYGGDGCKNDAERMYLLLKNMEGKTDRRASFVSSIACTLPDGRVIRARGEVRGLITEAPRGDNGFGYDPVFLLPEYGLTMAELTAEEKNKISHRAEALKRFKEKLKGEKLC